METQTPTRAQEFLEQLKAQQSQPDIVDVPAPSGLVYQMERPTRTKVLFCLGELPQLAASAAVEKWTEEGVLKRLEANDPGLLKTLKASLDVRDFVIAMSYSPKLVIGSADPAKNEISTNDVPDIDLLFLTRWVMSGGNAGDGPAMFPSGSDQHTDAGPNRSQRRAKAKRAGGPRS